jgi:DNA-binding response OmpR family regulator
MMHKILIVEDTMAVREEVYDILMMEGYSVFQAKDGLDGYEMALKENPDLIISDILMPVLNGFEMFEKLQNDYKTMSIPLIFLSAKGEKEDVRIGMNLGAEDYLTKPINVNDLVNAAENKIKKKISADQRIIDKTSMLTNTLENQKQQLDTFSDLILDGIKSSQNNILELLVWTQQELDETNNFEVSNNKIDNKWCKLGYINHKRLNTCAIAKLAKDKIHKPSHITITISPELPCIVADEYMLEKVFEILLQNAVDHIQNKIGLIELSCETSEKEYVFSIKYDYLRIQPEYHKNTFEKIQTIESSKSIGVELNIVKKIISHHNGKIYIKSIPNKETIFYFNLPKKAKNV